MIESGRRARQMPVSYHSNYALDFLFGRHRTHDTSMKSGGRAIELNPGDKLSVIWRKDA